MSWPLISGNLNKLSNINETVLRNMTMTTFIALSGDFVSLIVKNVLGSRSAC
jgi:hypothetical protein